MALLPFIAVAGAVFLWSTAVPGTKFAVAEIDAAEFVVLRLCLAAMGLWLLVLATRGRARPSAVGWRPFVMGLLEPGLVTFLMTLGLTVTSPVNGSVFWCLSPLITPVLGRLALGERIEPVVIIAAVIAGGGTALLASGQHSHGGGNLTGDLLLALGVLASSINTLIARRTAQGGANPLVTSSWQLTMGAGVALVLLAVLPAAGRHAGNASPAALGVLLFLGLVAPQAIVLWNYAIRHLPVGRMSLMGALVAPIGTALSAVVLGIPVSGLDLAAIALVMGAVALPSLNDRRRALSLS